MFSRNELLFLAGCYLGITTYFPFKQKSIKGKTILVTGAALGLGKSLALDLASLHAKTLIILDIQKDHLLATERAIHSKYPDVHVVSVICNLADKDDILRMADSILEEYTVDILINNAGVITGKNFLQLREDQIDLTMKINAMAHMYLTKAFLPGMIERQFGHIVGVASVAGLIGASGMVDYSASKFAVRGFYEALSIELHSSGVQGVNISCIFPTLINTGLFDGFYVPFNPTLQTEDVSKSIIWAIEHNREHLVIPGWLQITTLFVKGLVNFTGSLGIKSPFESPMKYWDSSRSDEAFHAISNHVSSSSKL